MPNHEHLDVLIQGVKVWNKWRKEHPKFKPYLDEINLSGTSLAHIDLSYADLSGATLTNVDLRASNIQNANLRFASFTHSDLRKANLSGTDLTYAVLDDVYLDSAKLKNVRFNFTKLRGARLGGADLTDVDFTDAIVGGTIFINNDFRKVKGLESVTHQGPSVIGFETAYTSQGNIPEAFLRGCGLSDWQVESVKLHQPELSNEEIISILYKINDLRAHQAIQINPLFISYSHTDSLFVDVIEKYLNHKGVRFWRDVHHATAGRLERQIDRAIRLNPTVLLILSEHSVQSDWVEHEARLARKLEIETKRDVLCPVALDDSWKSCAWPERLREQIMEYNILDFSAWRDEDKFRRTFGRLLDGLDLFYK